MFQLLPAKPGRSGTQTSLKSQPAGCHSICSCLRGASLAQLFSPAKGHSLSTEKETFVLPLGVPQFWAQCRKVQSPWGWLSSGEKKGDRVAKTFRASTHLCHSSFWGLNSFLLPLKPVFVLKRTADNQSFNEISKNLNHCFWVKRKSLILLENFAPPLKTASKNIHAQIQLVQSSLCTASP